MFRFIPTIIAFLMTVCSAGADDRWTTVLEKKDIIEIVVVDTNDIWVSYSNVCRYYNGEWIKFPSDMVRGQAIAYDGTNVWVGGKLVRKYDGKEWTELLNLNPIDDSGEITDMTFGSSGDLWAVTDMGLMMQFDGETWTRHTIADSGYATWFTSVAEDDEGSVWAGTAGDGLFRYDGNAWTHYTTADGLPSDMIRTVLIDEDGLWCGTEQGLCFFTETSATIFTTEDGLVHNNVHCIAFGINDDLWVGGGTAFGYDYSGPCDYWRTGGLSHFDNGVWSSYTEEDGLVRDCIVTLAVTPDGAVWCGTICGASIFTPDQTSVAGTSLESQPLININGSYPNPANSMTTINYTIAQPGNVSLAVYSVSGQKVATLADGFMPAGTHAAVFDGSSLASGLYLYRFKSKGFAKTGKIVLVK